MQLSRPKPRPRPVPSSRRQGQGQGQKVKVKKGHTQKERRRCAHLPFVGRWARRWINHYCLWRMASATLDLRDLRLPSQHKLVLMAPTHRGMARLWWPGWLVTYRDSLPARGRSPIQALTEPSVEFLRSYYLLTYYRDQRVTTKLNRQGQGLRNLASMPGLEAKAWPRELGLHHWDERMDGRTNGQPEDTTLCPAGLAW